MIVRDISLSHPVENILFDDVLLKLTEANNAGETLRFWESPTDFIVLGRIGKVEEDVNLKAVAANGIKILRRSSGGGTVVQGKGCLNYALILSLEAHPQLRDIKKSYEWVLGKVVSALASLGIQVQFLPISDIALVSNQKKVSGNAQKRSKSYILHHGTILCSFALEKIEHYLLMPKDKPAYRQDRKHLDFVTNIDRDIKDVKAALCAVFNANRENTIPVHEEILALKELIQTRDVELN